MARSKTARKRVGKKASTKRTTTRTSRSAKKTGVASRARKAGKSMMHKIGLDKPAVKKRVVTKIKRVGAAMARAAMDELVPNNEGRLPGESTAKGRASSNGSATSKSGSASPRSGRGGGR